MTITDAAKLAMAGAGTPAFSKMLPIADPEGMPGAEFLEDVHKIIASKQLTNGMYVRKFEETAAAYLGVEHCVAVASCTAGLLLVLKALNLRGEVILPSFTFHATAHAVAWNALKPVFADCDPETFCVDPKSVRERISSQTAAILGVHMFGNPAPVAELQEISNSWHFPLVFDAAHAFGSRNMGKRIGGFGVAEVFSFSPTKLVVAGEGGVIATSDARLAQTLRAARNYGDAGNYDPEIRGINARMAEINGALALRGLTGLEQRISRRNIIRERYEENLRNVPGIHFQRISQGSLSACKDFSILVDKKHFGQTRDQLVSHLRQQNIDARRYFSPPVHQQKLYSELWDRRPLPVTEYVSSSVVSLPVYSSLTDDAVDAICDVIRRKQQ
ncbi:MAG TPA: DegT/DnrJ/EryC1/StrS family aminotransferase [Candidatus Acidoferrum sp.]|jgi:dTDP-4-amino-4,6-dideoxygalactose transaminase